MPSLRNSFSPPAVGTKPTLSIRARLIVLALVALAPVLIDRIRLLQTEHSERVASAYGEVLRLTRRGVEAQQEVVASARAVLQVVSRSQAMLMAAGEGCSARVSELAAGVPWIKNLSIATMEGRIACSTLPNVIGVDISERPYFAEAVRSGNFVLSQYLVGRGRGTPTMVAALPVPPTGVITAGVDLKWIDRLGALVADHPGAVAHVVDQSGALLASYPAPRDAATKPAEHPLMRAVIERADGTATMPGLDGVRRMFAFQRLPDTDAYLVVGINEKEALGRIEREMDIGYVQLGLICAIVLFGVWCVGERLIVRPLRALARAAERIGRGNLDARVSSHEWSAEFAPLAAALDSMAHRLATREEELRVANRQLERLATEDGLSGLANRRSFDVRLLEEWARAGNPLRPLALLMIDVDHFKLFNDHRGHVAGDACLRRLGGVFAAAAEADGCFAARYGGEEFALLMPGADVAAALAWAERLRARVEQLAIPHPAAPSGRVTLSIGVAAARPGPGEDVQRLVATADAALYAAKRRGRNAAVAHSPNTARPVDAPAGLA